MYLNLKKQTQKIQMGEGVAPQFSAVFANFKPHEVTKIAFHCLYLRLKN